MEETNKIFLSPIATDFFDDIADLRRSGEFLIQYNALSDSEIINRFDDGGSKIYELNQEILKPAKFKKIGDELLITYYSVYSGTTINLGRIKKEDANKLLNQIHSVTNPVLVLIINGGRYKKVIHDNNNVPLVSVCESPYKIEILAVKSSNKAFDGQDDYSPIGLQLAKSGQLIRCPNCNTALKGERFCRNCELQIKYPNETDALDKIAAVGESLEKAGDSMSKTGDSMTLGCTIPILLIILIGILIGIL